MSSPYIAQIFMFGFNFNPKNYQLCNGALLPIASNQALFALVGTTFGGNGTSTFGLPNLQGRTPLHWGNGAGVSPYVIGEITGSVSNTILITQLPQHQHSMKVSSAAGTIGTPATNAVLAQGPIQGSGPTATNLNMYTSASNAIMGNTAIAGGSAPFSTMQPYTVVNFCICTAGLFPSRN